MKGSLPAFSRPRGLVTTPPSALSGWCPQGTFWRFLERGSRCAATGNRTATLKFATRTTRSMKNTFESSSARLSLVGSRPKGRCGAISAVGSTRPPSSVWRTRCSLQVELRRLHCTRFPGSTTKPRPATNGRSSATSRSREGKQGCISATKTSRYSLHHHQSSRQTSRTAIWLSSTETTTSQRACRKLLLESS